MIRKASLATTPAVVCTQEPAWMVELLALLSLVLLIAWLVAVVELAPMAAEISAARRETTHWKLRATAPPETFVGVRIERDGVGFRCQVHNVRREWERAIAGQCETLGSMLLTARTTP